MSKIKLPLDHSKQAPQKSASAGRLKLARLFSVGGIGLLLAVLLAATITTGFPRHALAAGVVTITDVITFPDSVPSNVTANQDQIVIGSDTGTYIGSGMSSSVTKNGNTATFTINIGSVANSSNPSKSITPIPAGNYSVSSFGSSGTGTVVVAADGSGKTTISGGSSCGDSICSLSAAATSTQQLATACGASDCSNVGDSLAGLTQGSAPGSDHSNNVTCDTGGFGINWILCPVFNSVAGISGWLFSNIVQPFLRTTPISTDPSDTTYKIWSNFRVYGDIFLVIALLVVVFGQSLGGGLIDAYTAKKVLPRLLAAAILINLSIYVVAALVDITNILGGGIGNIMTAPLKGAGAFNISPSGVQGGEILGLSGVGIIGGLGAGVLGLLASASAIANFAVFIALFVIMPVVFGLLAAFLTLVVRKAMILALILVSPIAFALYCLPNTEQYFKKWWELLIQTLAVYPIVIIFFAVADILSVTIMQANGSANVIAPIISFVLQFLPLLFIPYAFRLAGGAIERMHEAITTGHKRMQENIKGNPNDPNSLRNRAKRNVSSSLVRQRAQNYRSLKGRGRVGRRLASATTLLGDPLAAEAMANEESKKRIFGIKDNGDDAILNAAASFVDTRKYLANGAANEMFGKRVTLDGNEVNEADYRSAKRLYPNMSDIQAVADYRSTKVNSTQEAEDFAERYGMMAQENGLSLEETKSAFTALSFARQNERGEWKHGKWIQQNGAYKFVPVGGIDPTTGTRNLEGASKYVNEQYHKKGAFDASRAFSSQFQAMSEVKQVHLDEMDRVRALGGAATADDRKSANASREELRKILEIQDAWGRRSGAIDPATGLPIAGLQGASPATQAAYDDLVSRGQDDPYHVITMKDLQQEIDEGYTWEHLNNMPKPQV